MTPIEKTLIDLYAQFDTLDGGIDTRGGLEHKREQAFLFADWVFRVCCGIECESITDQETVLAAYIASRAATDANAAFRAVTYAASVLSF